MGVGVRDEVGEAVAVALAVGVGVPVGSGVSVRVGLGVEVWVGVSDSTAVGLEETGVEATLPHPATSRMAQSSQTQFKVRIFQF